MKEEGGESIYGGLERRRDIYLFLEMVDNNLSVILCVRERERGRGNKERKGEIGRDGTWALFPCLPFSYEGLTINNQNSLKLFSAHLLGI